jgi:hypothetical protein
MAWELFDVRHSFLGRTRLICIRVGMRVCSPCRWECGDMMKQDGSCKVFLVCTQGSGGNLLRQQQRPKQRKRKPFV